MPDPATKTIDLAFGSRTFAVRPLTLSQVCDLAKLFDGDIGKMGQVERMKLARDAIEIALRRDHAEADVDDLECDVRELPKQLIAIMRLGGFDAGGAA